MKTNNSMFNFGGITHVVRCPDGHKPGYNFALVGAVPASMLERAWPTREDILGGRVQSDGFAYHDRKWETIEDIQRAAIAAGDVQLCTMPTCACRKLF